MSDVKLFLELCRDIEQISVKKQKKTRILFFGRDSFSDNCKYLYLYMIKEYSHLDIQWCSTNESLIEDMVKNELPCFNLNKNTRKSMDFLLESAIAIFCVNPLDSVGGNMALLASLRGALTFQMWHGIGPKEADLALTELKDISNINVTRSILGATSPEYYISSSVFIDSKWRKFFGAQKILRAGYPRNELMLRAACDKELLGSELNESTYRALYNKENKKVLLAPTWEKNAGLNNIAMLSAIVMFCQENNITAFIKLHPFIKDNGINDIISSNLYNLPSDVDIYPHLSAFDALITDYSSIAYDFILTGKPVATIDINKGEDFDYSLIPGDDEYRYKINHDNLVDTLSEMFYRDSKADKRDSLARTLFETDNTRACADIARKIINIYQERSAEAQQIY
ncbi:CDP-glycerol glycerophosphotransferase family protein [Dryocola clanedunensis]|uniref:CDP-glycerol glycerophosphotransferase family protein n=1 Tax=Cedecea sulfonylureivorans TaxID=3051154 RepID=UPI0019257F3C|nr:CDP-glycerol glycerophosphotransferase family protein [Cedecea sulfonylureivorans]